MSLQAFFKPLTVWFLLVFSFTANAQVVLRTQPTSIALSDTAIEVLITSVGPGISDPYRIKIWASFDAQIGDDDLVETSGLNSGLWDGALSSPLGPLAFKLPTPSNSGSGLPRLVGDTLNPRDWIGRNMYYRVCILDEGGAETDCNSLPSVGVPLIVTPPNRLTRPKASKGVSNEHVELFWQVPLMDNGSLLIDRYIVNQTDATGGVTKLEFSIDDFEVTTLGNIISPEFYRVRTTQISPGVRYNYTSGNLVCLGNVCSSSPNSIGSNEIIDGTGNAYASISASTNINGKIEIDWEPFSTATLGYSVYRCELNAAEDKCAQLANLIGATNFSDTNVERGIRYIYRVDACERINDNVSPSECVSEETYKIAVSSPGESGLVDEFEDDDNPQQATLVERSASQLHSFDTPIDEDWIKIVIANSQSIEIRTSGETSEDTKITLYSSGALGDLSNLSEYEIAVATNTPGVQFASFATLITNELEPGEYFAKVEQESIPGLPPLNVFNYTLDVEFQDSIVIAPIINLLLSD